MATWRHWCSKYWHAIDTIIYNCLFTVCTVKPYQDFQNTWILCVKKEHVKIYNTILNNCKLYSTQWIHRSTKVTRITDNHMYTSQLPHDKLPISMPMTEWKQQPNLPQISTNIGKTSFIFLLQTIENDLVLHLLASK